MEQRQIALGERTFVLRELPIRANAEWRRLFESKLEPLLGMISGLDSIEINTAADLAALVPALREIVLRAPDTLTDLIVAYSPELQAAREWLDANAYESELLAAIQEVLQLAYPFAAILALARRLNGAAKALGEQT